MKAHHILPLAFALLAAGPAHADNMADMPGMKQETPGAKTGQGEGVITAIDPVAGKLTLKHGPIQAFGWPAMTMPFKVNPPALLKGLTIGRKVAFDVRTQPGKAPEIVDIRPL